MRDILIQTRDVLSRGDTTTALVLAGIAVVAILVIVGALLFVARMYTPRGRLELLLEHRSPERARNPWITRFVVVLVIGLTAFATTHYAERPQSCVTCHSDPVYAEGLAESPHAGVGCAECHRSAGITARADDTVRYAGWLWTYYVRGEEVLPGDGAYVDPRRCLACHEDVREGVIERDGVRVRHSDFLDAGTDCVLCHAGATHAAPRAVQAQPIMNSCMRCHDGEAAPVECAVCHTQDLGIRAVAARGGQMATVGAREVDCYTCHDERPCFECHGIEIPHPPGFSYPLPPGATGLPGRIATGHDPGTHARPGFENREVCWRCHFAPGRPFEPSNEGCYCHGLFGFLHGGPAWVQEHGLQATGQKPGVVANCDMCHGPVDRFCGWCHPPGYAERYAPRFGADDYTPSPGWPRPVDPTTDF